MNALDVISLESAKENLVIDYTDQDANITRFIKSAVSIIEKYTNVFLYERPVNYTITSGCSNEIFDYPISFTTTGLKTKQNVLSVTVYGKQGDSFSANVGYANVDDVPTNLIDACYKLITYLFENRDAYTATLPADIQCMVNQFRRNPTI